jgi:hypothetical protein
MCREFGLPPIGLRIKRALRSDRKTITVIPATAFFYRKANQVPAASPPDDRYVHPQRD